MKRNARLAIVLASAIVTASMAAASAQNAQPQPAVLEFDEIDHVFTTEPVPPPGSFRQHAGLLDAAPAAAPAPKRKSIFDTLTTASTVLGSASSVVGASGEVGRTLGIADAFASFAPVTTAMGMAGGRRFDALLQTYVLPHVSPTGAVQLQGFLSAQAEYKARFGTSQSGAAPAAPPPALQVYAKGALRHYTVGSNGWVRIDDPNTNLTLVIKPDAGKTYLIDNGAKTVRTLDTASAAAAPGAASGGAAGTAAVSDRVDALGQTTLDGVSATGFRTQSTVHVSGGAGACSDATITSTRVEYFAPSRVGSAANMSPAAQSPDGGGCNPSSTVKHEGAKVPADQLMLYQANTVEKQSGGTGDRYTVLIERGNVQERNAYDTAPFDIPSGLRRI